VAAALVATPPPTPASTGPALPAKPPAPPVGGPPGPPGAPPTAPSLPPRSVDPATAAALAVPVDTSVAATPGQPEALKPQAPVKKKPPKVVPGKPTRTPQKGDLICGECGEANVPSRRFCSRCGTTLASATKAKVHWWTRLARKFRRSDLRAGERPWEQQGTKVKKPRKRGFAKVFQQVRRIGGIVLLVGGLLYGVYAPFRNKVNSIYNSGKDKVTSFIHPGKMAVDLAKNTYWLSPVPNPAQPVDQRPFIDVTFPEATNLSRVIVRDGAFDNFGAFARPKTLLFLYDDGQQFELTLKNDPEPQTHSIKFGGKRTHVRIFVTDIYLGSDPTQMALTEIEFKTKKK
jgi:hypothetical protein